MDDNPVPPAPRPIPPAEPSPVIPASPPIPPPPAPISPPPPPVPPPTPPVSHPTPPPPPSRPSTSPGVIPSSGPSKIKRVLFLLVLLLFLAVVGMFAFRFLQGRTGGGGTQTLTYWGLWEPESVMRPLLDEFEQQHPGVKVNYSLQKITEYRERLSSALSQGQGPDIMRLHSSWIPMFRSQLSPMPANVYSPAEYDATFYPVAKRMLNFGGSYYAIPLEYDGLALYVNEDLLAQNNLSVPKTWDELRIAAIAMSRCLTPTGVCAPGARVDVAGVGMGTTNNIDHWQDIVSLLLLQNGANLSAPTGEAADAVFAYFANFSRTHGTWSAESPTSTQMFGSGKLGLYFAPSWRVFDIKAINPNLKFSIHPVPQLPVDLSRDEKPIQWASFWVESVNAKSPNAALSWELLKFLSSKDSQVKLFAAAKASGRDFGEPYSRKDLAGELATDPFVGPYLEQADLAHSWYLASSTFDGANGLNTQLSNAFAQSVTTGAAGGLSSQISDILGKYGLSSGSTP